MSDFNLPDGSGSLNPRRAGIDAADTQGVRASQSFMTTDVFDTLAVQNRAGSLIGTSPYRNMIFAYPMAFTGRLW